jgi:leucyl-tRNA synthetase
VQTPLSRAPDSWKYVVIDGKRFTRELNTMPQWAGSCWYYLRFCDPGNGERFVGEAAERYWMVSMKRGSGTGSSSPHAGGVDMYVGGAEHAVLHLLYARFWHKVLFDLGYVSTPEPFGRLFNQGYIQAYCYRDSRGIAVPADKVEERDGKFIYENEAVAREMGKMGKSLKNAVTPDEICDQYGCDTMRLYEMYLGPLDQSKLWNTRDIIGVHRFLQRLWRNFIDEETGALLVTDEPAAEPLRRLLHKTTKRVSDDMERMSYNTAIAALIELNNELVPLQSLPREVAATMLLLLAPMAPHIAEELWQRLHAAASQAGAGAAAASVPSLAYEPWPTYDPALLVESTIEYPVQINGKLRGRITVAADADSAAIEAAARADAKVAASLGDKPIKKVIVIKGKMVNIVQ